MNTNHYTSCPVCGGNQLSAVLQVRDYTVSNELFNIVECGSCSLRLTQDVPGELFIGPYYKSENYISHTNTSKGLINGLYQRVRKRTLRSKAKLIESETEIKEGVLLDIGSGTGSFVNAMQQHGWKVLGLEPDPDARKVAKDSFGIELSGMEMMDTLPVGTYDAITLWHVMEHVHQLQDYVKRLRTLLKKDGRLFIAVPNYTSTDATDYGKYWAAYDVPRHLYHFSPKSMDSLMQGNGMKITAYKPMWFDSFYISLLSSKYKNGRSNLVGAFFTGLWSNIKAMGNPKRCSSVTYVVEVPEPSS